jgi:ABC-type histidine transport system ATPase subunit
VRMRAGMVFQEFNLFPHLSVIENCVEAPIHVKGMARKEAEAIAEKYLAKADSVSASPLRARSPCSRRCCCSTSQHRRSTQRWSVRCSR